MKNVIFIYDDCDILLFHRITRRNNKFDILIEA